MPKPKDVLFWRVEEGRFIWQNFGSKKMVNFLAAVSVRNFLNGRITGGSEGLAPLMLRHFVLKIPFKTCQNSYLLLQKFTFFTSRFSSKSLNSSISARLQPDLARDFQSRPCFFSLATTEKVSKIT